jgi:hypothetical protein
MKKLIILVFTFLSVFSFSTGAAAQEKSKTQLSSVKQKDATILFSLSSSQPFIFANNRYLLYIGNKEFHLQEQTNDDDGTGHMSFFVQPGDFDKLQEGSAMYLTYGAVDIENANMEELANYTRRCWSLGKFSKTLLTK